MCFKPPFTVSELLGHYFILAVSLEDCLFLSFASEFMVNRLWRENGSAHKEAGSLYANSKNTTM